MTGVSERALPPQVICLISPDDKIIANDFDLEVGGTVQAALTFEALDDALDTIGEASEELGFRVTWKRLSERDVAESGFRFVAHKPACALEPIILGLGGR